MSFSFPCTYICICTEVFLFADDTNITAVHSQNESLQADLGIISNWLNANKNALNLNKIVRVDLNYQGVTLIDDLI